MDKGGWSVFPAGFPSVDFGNPALAGGMRTNGKDAWVGWPDSPRIEALHDDWMDSTDIVTRKRLAEQIQLERFSDVPYICGGSVLMTGVLIPKPRQLRCGVPSQHRINRGP